MIKNSNYDDPSKLIAIIEAIKTVGPRNCSLISRMTKIPVETVRYKLLKQLIKKGISFRPIFDFETIGLKRAFVRMKFSKELENSATKILNNLHPFGLTYYSRILLDGSYETIFAMPKKYVRKYEFFFNELIEEGILESFEISLLDWVQMVSLRPEYYDFKKGDWKVDWYKLVPMTIRLSNEEKVIPKRKDEVDVDYVDLLIVHVMQQTGSYKINQIARSLKINPKVVRYHLVSHLIKNGIIASYFVTWRSLKRGTNELIGSLVKVRNVSDEYEIAKLQEVALKLPFTWMYAYSSSSKTFYILLAIPNEHYINLLQVLTDSLSQFSGRVEHLLRDFKNVRSFTVPIALYDKDLNEWVFNEEKALRAIETITRLVKIEQLSQDK